MEIPENNGRTKKPGFLPKRGVPKPVGKPEFAGNPAVNNIRKKARNAALKSRIDNAKSGTPHQQHLAHMKHMANVKNNPEKYG